MSNSKFPIEPFLRRDVQTSGPGGLPVLQPYVAADHDPLVHAGGHSRVSIERVEPGAKVSAKDFTNADIVGEIVGSLDQEKGVYWVRPETSVKEIPVNAWTVRSV